MASSEGESPSEANPVLTPRAYQLEMLEESLRQNTIVAMDTGSGKTQIAILRIQAELERCSREKRVWFLTPTVALAEQQYKVISQHIPTFQARILTGNDNVDRWRSQRIWDTILCNIRIVVCTHQVLLDALSSGFVKLREISLLVFDEAHRCIKNHASNGIMQLYHQARIAGAAPLPSVLGLTASPASKANEDALKTLEKNLHAICKTPVVNREELLKHVRKPEVSKVSYAESSEDFSELQKRLFALAENAKAEIDKHLKSQKDEGKKAVVLKQINSLRLRAQVIHKELGPWAADVFVATCVERFKTVITEKTENDPLWALDSKEKQCLMRLLTPLIPAIDQTRHWGSQPDLLSQKAELLMQTIADNYSPGCRIIVFAEQRATVIMLAHLLSVHPLTKGIAAGYFLGLSSYANRKPNIVELDWSNKYKHELDDFRSGKKSILVATSVLEEGIDVPACNIVICYDPPKELRSFIQRRGRARDRNSKLITFVNENDPDSNEKWTLMEAALKRIYEDNTRAMEEILAQEEVEEESTEYFKLKSTEAILNHRNARQYLEFFCATGPKAHLKARPDFVLQESPFNGRFTAKVILPNFVPPWLRQTMSKTSWLTQKAAKRDAAYEAYLALYHAGLVNDNLIPLHAVKGRDEADPAASTTRGGLIKASERHNPWIDIAFLLESGAPLFRTEIIFEPNFLDLTDMVLLLPRRLPCEWTFTMYWDEENSFLVRLRPTEDVEKEAKFEDAATLTWMMLRSTFPQRIPKEKCNPVSLFWPKTRPSDLPPDEWLESMKGHTFAREVITEDCDFLKLGLARSVERFSRLFIPERIIYQEPTERDKQDMDEEELKQPTIPFVHGSTLPRRSDFLHPIVPNVSQPTPPPKTKAVALRRCIINKLPAIYSRYSIVIPSIAHQVDMLLFADRLNRTVLADVNFSDLRLLLTAVSASSAQGLTNYQRMEFLGDSLLKTSAAIHLVARHPLWHEGLLSVAKDKLVSNERLTRVALNLGLDRYILTRPFTGNKWRPSYVPDLIAAKVSQGTRDLSSKVLADVIEALLAAAYLDGGQEKLLRCLRTFLPNVPWSPLEEEVERLSQHGNSPGADIPTPILEDIEGLLDYHFRQPELLLEALTHPCCGDKNSMSYQRLEFLGDSLLDHIVVEELWRHEIHLPHQSMSEIRTAVVNADFLAFLCMRIYKTEKRTEPAAPGEAHNGTVEVEHKTYLHQYLRHSASREITLAQQEALRRHHMYQDAIEHALTHDGRYPWELLLRLEAGKFFSDLMEALLGAIFIDSRGDFDTCRQFLRRIGLLKFLERVIRDRVEIRHPHSRLHEAAGNRKVVIETKPEKPKNNNNNSNNSNSNQKGQGKNSANESEPARIRWISTVRMGERILATVTDGQNRAEAEARASLNAAMVLESERNNPGGESSSQAVTN